MAIILNIDTAVETASVCLSENEKSLGLMVNNQQKDHASWLHPAIKKLMDDTNMSLRDIDAVAVATVFERQPGAILQKSPHAGKIEAAVYSFQ